MRTRHLRMFHPPSTARARLRGWLTLWALAALPLAPAAGFPEGHRTSPGLAEGSSLESSPLPLQLDARAGEGPVASAAELRHPHGVRSTGAGTGAAISQPRALRLAGAVRPGGAPTPGRTALSAGVLLPYRSTAPPIR